jgi:arsenate reductase
MSNVLFVCIQNAGRSQIAKALFDRTADGRHNARSAGSRPAAHVHPEVVEALAEQGIDISHNVPHELDRADMEWADVVITMGCGDECPYIPGKRYVDWELTDPAGQPIEVVREVRDDISRRVEALLVELARSPAKRAKDLHSDLHSAEQSNPDSA